MRSLLWLLLALPAASAAEEPLVLVVMDPLAAPLSCPCVEGYAQRDYSVLAERLGKQLGRDVVLGFGESLAKGQQQADRRPADLVLGKDSVVRSDAAKLGTRLTPLAQLTDKQGSTTQQGLLVVRDDDPATEASQLANYQVFFGPADSNEKHAAALRLLAQSGVSVAKPTAESISAACSDGACRLIDLGPEARSVAVISSYAAPLLEGCGTIEPGDLRVVAKTDPVPFITLFATDRVDAELASRVADVVMALANDRETLAALESLLGFLPINDAYEEAVQKAGALPSTPDESKELTESPQAAWPGWGGPSGNGVVEWLPEQLPDPLPVVWRVAMRREGIGGIAVGEGCVVIGDRNLADSFDVWRCYDAETGKPLWRRTYPAAGQLDYGNGPRATPLIDQGRVYLQGAMGHLVCVQLDSGKRLWQRHLRDDFQASEPLIWGLCASPLLADGLLIVSPGTPDAAWVALDAETGVERWRTPGDRHGYATPRVATLGGRRQLIAYDRTSLGGWDLPTGRRLWTLHPPRQGDFNVPTPALIGNDLLLTSENNGTRRYRFDSEGRIDPEPIATYDHLAPDTSSPVVAGNRVYCVWEDLFCLEGSSGKLTDRWIGSDEAFPQAGALIAGKTTSGAGRLLVVGKSGELLLIDADAEEMQIVSRADPFGVDPTERADLLTLPALAGDHLYLRGEESLVCLRLGEQ